MRRLFWNILLLPMLAVSCKQETYYNISTRVQPEGSGTVAVSPSSGSVLEGTSISFKATPNGEYIFTGWSGSLSGTENSKTVTATADMDVVANFQLKTYPLSVSVEGDGTVNERVVSTKADYGSGTVVELTAQPADYWLFDHWEGDLTGSDNPAKITVSGAKSVKAVFAKHKYAYNLKIVGPGVVDEYLVQETKANLEYGTQVLLKASTSKNAVFKGWSGAYSGNNEEITISIDEPKELIATFELDYDKYSWPLVDLYEPSSVTKRLYYGVDFSTMSYYPTGFIAVDYNMDGYIDVITCEMGRDSQFQRHPMNFFLGPDFRLDNENSGYHLAPICTRKSFTGDFNGDGKIDVCFVGHGNEGFPDPKDYPVFLLSNENNTFSRKGIEECFEYYHGSAAGDFDNDGDLDVVLLNSSDQGVSCILVNDGTGNFTPRYDLLNHYWMEPAMYTIEFYDVDNDGFLDIVCGGNDFEGRNSISKGYYFSYDDAPFVLWGNGITYANSPISRMESNYQGFGCNSDFAFYDLDGNGTDEILIAKSTDSLPWEDGVTHEVGYGWMIHVFERDGRSFTDATKKFVIDDDYFHLDEIINIWISIETIDNQVYLLTRKEGRTNAEKLYVVKDNKLIRVHDEEDAQPLKYTNGICFYSDGVGTIGEHVQLDWSDNPYSGKTCMRFTNWATWNGWAVDYEDWIDFSELEKQGYVLEFAIKNSDPDMQIVFSFETRLQTDPGYFPSYGYTYHANEHKCDGTWELIQTPLSEMACNPEWTGYYWNTIKTLNIMPWDYHGKDFYLDEIRIRKVIPE